MTVTAASFREMFTEFADAAKYPDVRLASFITLAGQMMNADRWGDLADYGAMLFVAHHVSLQAKRIKDARFGKVPGQASGIVNNKSVDKVSIGYDTQSTAEEGAGHWNLTAYGQEYIRLAKNMGIGPVQVGAPSEGDGVSMYSSAYAGPYQGW